MVLDTPQQDKIVESSNTIPIRKHYSDYEATFLILHPFLKKKEGIEVAFETGSWPNKKQILENMIPVSWSKIIECSGLNDIKELDRLLAYLHAARKTADKGGWEKLIDYVNKNDLVVPQVDNYPEILINKTLDCMKQMKYDSVFLYSEYNSTNQTIYNIKDLIDDENGLPESQPRILTPDKKILFETDFDQRFTFLSSDKLVIESLILNIELEGFYCDNKTRLDWSYEEQKDNLIFLDSEER